MVNKRQIALGLTALFIGLLVYITDRSPEQTWFLDGFLSVVSLYDICPPLFGFLGQVLPDFLHILAFILLTAGVSTGGRKGFFFISLFWLVVDMGFELGQKYSSLATKLVPDWFDEVFLLENTKNYFICGTYSSLDLVAVIAGAGVAYGILICTCPKEEMV